MKNDKNCSTAVFCMSRQPCCLLSCHDCRFLSFGYVQIMVLCFLVFWFPSLYHVLLCLCFIFPLLRGAWNVLPSVSLCCTVPFMFRHVLLPLISTPGLLPPLTSPVPPLFINVCVFSLCLPLTPCPVIVFVSPYLPMHLFQSVPVCSRLFPVPPWYVFLDFWNLWQVIFELITFCWLIL